jgi:plasmid stabilization system protein ParE
VKPRLIVRPKAELDISNAAVWYEHERPGLGHRFLDELDELLEQIERSPLQFPEIESEVRRGLLRRFPYGVYFVVGSRGTVVLAVLHLHRHTNNLERPEVVFLAEMRVGLDNTPLDRTIGVGILVGKSRVAAARRSSALFSTGDSRNEARYHRREVVVP